MFPPVCACCGARAETGWAYETVASSKRVGNAVHSTTYKVQIPYCNACKAHADEANAIPFMGFWVVVFMFTLGLGFLGDYLYVRAIRLPRIRRQRCKPECCRPDPVGYSASGQTHTIGSTNPTFVEAFRAANPRR
ncbi:MAG: hypothetical protein IT379_27055 [Deltaproteobacteria bacterium]|nr:hypothetical protein [Deltaproteobacteria bacterium]